ncbi:hypothetical protein [Dapis sp. BLCC M229]|uniref:hypothetical protein n=1 Tax=Dapis sp. BLCC M229 TaxID=3400188 RepID=UPI003CE7475A
MLKDKAMIIIAVSKYAGAYDNLPGAITSARRLHEWAQQPSEDCHYNVLYLADDVYPKIDVQLVGEKVHDFVNNNFIDRLVVYFAGHGIVRSAGDQFWLLTDAENDEQQGINVEAFKRGLLKCNIGNDNFAGQLCIIGDACRNTGRNAIDFYGSPILSSRARMNRRIQLDRFLSTSLGDYSFQINQTDSQSAYCLFSEMMLSALHGEVKEAIETQGEFRPAVTNHKLADYLEKEVRNCAAEIEERMEPDIITGIRPPYNFYKRVGITLDPPAVVWQSAIQMAIRDSRNEELTELQERRKQTILQLKDRIAENILPRIVRFNRRLNPDIPNFSTISDFRPKYVAIPKSGVVEVFQEETFYQIGAINCYDYPILILQDQQWIIVPNYPNVATIISHNLPGDILFLKTGDYIYLRYRHRERHREEYELWDTYLSDFSNLVGSVPLRAADAQKFADRIRVGKEEYPHQAVTAGYLYEFSNDYDNIARTAHYMAYDGVVPFDLALLCADKIWWSKEKGRLVAFADLPAVEPLQTSDKEEYRPYYARRGFKKRKNVRLWGIAPIFSQGWSFMQTELYLKIPEHIRRIGENITGRSATSLTQKGLEMFLKAFDYQVIQTDTDE